MEEPKYSIDLRTNNGWWARAASFFVGGRLVTPEKGSQMGPTSASGHLGDSAITDERILQISTVWRCVSLISTLTASLPLDVLETDKEDNRRKVGMDNPLARLLRFSPNQYMTAQDFREAMTMQLCFYGNAYALIERNAVGDVVSLLPLMSANMDVRLEGKKLVYRYQRDTEYANFSQRDIFHLKGFGFNGLVGLSPIAHACKSAGVAVAMEDQQRDFFANGAKSPQLLKTDKVLTKEQRAQVEDNFKEIAGGPVKKRLWILEAAFETSAIGVTPQDAEMMASRKFQVSELARFFGVPPHLVGDVEKSTSWGTGIEQQNLGFLQYTLQPYISRWENCIQRWLLKPEQVGKYHAEHNLDGLLRGDSASRAAFMKAMGEAGLRTINEMRRLDNMPPLPGGDVAFRQAQYVPITQLGNNTGTRESGS
ncbi:phage portal protein [Erwinia aphidicola]|uniref:phage portal protein n=1 Tax=Erwinia aphidicola TaxID=68334 RepID=UPI0030CC6588